MRRKEKLLQQLDNGNLYVIVECLLSFQAIHRYLVITFMHGWRKGGLGWANPIEKVPTLR